MNRPAFLKHTQHRKYRFTLFLMICLSVALAEIGFRQNWFSAVDQAGYDTYHTLAGKRSHAPLHVVIAAIDGDTLKTYPDDPLVFWGPYFAEAISTIRRAGARAIGMDIIFSVSPETWFRKIEAAPSDLSRSYDASFRRELNHPDMILSGQATLKGSGLEGFLLPAEDYLYSLPDAVASVGLANLVQDGDGTVRSFMVNLFEDDVAPNMTFAPLLAQRAGYSILPDGLKRIGFVGPPGTVPRIPFYKLVDPDQAEFSRIHRLVADKIVIFSVEQDGINDAHFTPYSGGLFTSGQVRLMRGAELHANIVESVISNRFPENLPFVPRIAWVIGAAVLIAVLLQAMGPRWGITLMLCIMAGSVLMSYFLFLRDVLAPVANVGFALVCSYFGFLCLRLTREEKERHHLENIFSPYVSEMVMTDLLSRETKPALGGEELEVTTLFSDIRGFTTLSEKLSPSEVVEILNRYYTLVCEEIISQGGIVDKFIGDAVMAIFGAPLPYPDHALRAVRTARSMVAISREFRIWLADRFPDRDIPVFRIGIGINTGKVLMGNIGSKKRMEYTAIGDTVNIASRLEGLCKELGWTIVASQATVNAAGPDVVCARRDTTTLRGRTGATPVFEISGLTTNEQDRKATG